MKPNESQVGEGLTRGPKAKKKKESFEQRQRKISTEDLLAQDSALIGANLKDFINEETFNNLPIQQQWELMRMLPACDLDISDSGSVATSRDTFNNEFFTRALTSFPERISDGEFTSAMKARISIESCRRRIDPWKEKFFEEYWGQLSEKKPDPADKLKAEKMARLDEKLVKVSPVTMRNTKSSPHYSNGVSKTEEKINNEATSSEAEKPLPDINHCDKIMIKSWEAEEAVKALSPNLQRDDKSSAIPIRVIQQNSKMNSIRVSIDQNVFNAKSSTSRPQQVTQCSSVNVSPAGSSLAASDSPASRGQSNSPSSASQILPTTPTPKFISQSESVNNFIKQSIKSPEKMVSSQIPRPTSVVRLTNQIPRTQTQMVTISHLPPIPALHPAPGYQIPSSSGTNSQNNPTIGQKRARTLADIRAEVAQKKARPSVITYCQPRPQPMPIKVIQSVQKAVPNDRVLILTPVKGSGGAKLYTVVSAGRQKRTPLQASTLGTSVITTHQLQRTVGETRPQAVSLSPASQSGVAQVNPSQTFVIKKNPNRLEGHRQLTGPPVPNQTSVIRQSGHSGCSNEPYAQCSERLKI